MALITFGTVVTGAWTLYKYWRIPYRLFLWHNAKEVEPAAGQIWLEAGLSPKDNKWKVKITDRFRIEVISVVSKGDAVELDLNWDDWAAMVKKSRMFCFDKHDSIDNRFWGDAAE